ncbi:MAG: TIGR00266 family protein [Myxococcales bacterium]|nr:TIGR00266 family protein [Myxococcales bacterium]
MRTEIIDSPDFSFLRLTFDEAGESVVSESGAMVSRDTAVEMKTNMRGSVGGALKRKVLGGESMFQNTFTSTAAGQHVVLAPAVEGDMREVHLSEGETWFLQRGSYVAHTGGVVIDTKWAGFKGFFGGAGLFLLKLSGPGTLFYCGYGALREIELNGEEYVVDNEHVVGFTEHLQYKVEKFAGYKGLFFSGEGLVTRFQGTGKVILQTRNPSSLAAFMQPYRPTKNDD